MVDSQTPTGEDPNGNPPGSVEERRPQSRHEKLDAVVKALEGEDPKPAEKPAEGKPTEGEDPKPDGKLESLDDVAKRLGVEVSDLYKIAVKQAPGAGGEDQTVTLGELADKAKEWGQFELDRMEFEETKTKREADLMRGQQQLNELVAMLPKSALSKDLLQAVANKIEAAQKAERELTLKVIPEWSSETVENEERAAISESLKAYGFSDNYLDTVADHRTLKYIRDNWKRQQVMDRTLAALKQMRKSETPQPGRREGKAPTKPQEQRQGRRTGRRQSVSDKTQAVADVLATATEG